MFFVIRDDPDHFPCRVLSFLDIELSGWGYQSLLEDCDSFATKHATSPSPSATPDMPLFRPVKTVEDGNCFFSCLQLYQYLRATDPTVRENLFLLSIEEMRHRVADLIAGEKMEAVKAYLGTLPPGVLVDGQNYTFEMFLTQVIAMGVDTRFDAFIMCVSILLDVQIHFYSRSKSGI